MDERMERIAKRRYIRDLARRVMQSLVAVEINRTFVFPNDAIRTVKSFELEIVLLDEQRASTGDCIATVANTKDEYGQPTSFYVHFDGDHVRTSLRLEPATYEDGNICGTMRRLEHVIGTRDDENNDNG